MEINIHEKPCLVSTERGFTVSYQNRFLYSKYAPSRTIESAISSLQILSGTLILAYSPVLWLGLDSLLKKLPENCFVLGIECDKNLHEFAQSELEKRFAENDSLKEDCRFCLLPFEQNEYIVNVLTGLLRTVRNDEEIAHTGEKIARNDEITIPHISHFRRAIVLEMSAGVQFHKDEYAKIASLSQNAIASFWKNRITLTKLGKLFSKNLFKNLAHLPCSIDFNTFLHKITQPIFVFGAGESIEQTIQTIGKKEIEKCFVISVDAAASTLKSFGIRLDAICALEGQLAIEKAYIGGSAAHSLLISDMTGREEVTRHALNVTYIASKYTDSEFFKNLTQKEFFPSTLPPLGSVGLAAVYIALSLRENQNIPVFFCGLDFSFSLGRTHAKNTPAHIARLCTSNRFASVENYAASFRNGAKKIVGKNGIAVFTDTALESYAKSFVDFFETIPNLYDCAQQGLPLGTTEISNEKVLAYLQTIERGRLLRFTRNEGQFACKAAIKNFLELEEKALNRIKELLMFGNDVASCSISLEDELYSLISVREYLFLHFPDGYRCNTRDLSFLKRVRSQIDFFLKYIKIALSNF